jgi:hypothetical protein
VRSANIVVKLLRHDTRSHRPCERNSLFIGYATASFANRLARTATALGISRASCTISLASNEAWKCGRGRPTLLGQERCDRTIRGSLLLKLRCSCRKNRDADQEREEHRQNRVDPHDSLPLDTGLADEHYTSPHPALRVSSVGSAAHNPFVQTRSCKMSGDLPSAFAALQTEAFPSGSGLVDSLAVGDDAYAPSYTLRQTRPNECESFLQLLLLLNAV